MELPDLFGPTPEGWVKPSDIKRTGTWFVYTLWYPLDFVKSSSDKVDPWSEDVKYHIRGSLEICPDTKRGHLHGVFTLWKKTSAKEAQRIIGFPPGTAYVGAMTASDSREARAYVTKTRVSEGFPITESGVFVVEAGQRTDIQGAVKILKKEGHSGLATVKKEFGEVYVKYHRGFEKYVEPIVERKQRVIENHERYFIQGETGLRKTSWIKENFPDLYVFSNTNGNMGKWWDGYDGQEFILIDEYEGGWEPAFIKQLCDRWTMNVQVKGGFVTLAARVIFFVSNRSFVDCFGDKDGIVEPAIQRRFITCVWTQVGVPPLPLIKYARLPEASRGHKIMND